MSGQHLTFIQPAGICIRNKEWPVFPATCLVSEMNFYQCRLDLHPVHPALNLNSERWTLQQETWASCCNTLFAFSFATWKRRAPWAEPRAVGNRCKKLVTYRPAKWRNSNQVRTVLVLFMDFGPISTLTSFKLGWNGAYYSSPQPKIRQAAIAGKPSKGRWTSWPFPVFMNPDMWPGKVKEKDMFLTWTRFTRIFMFNWGELLEALHVDFGSASEVFSPAERPGTGGSGGNGATEDLREPERAETWSLQLRGLQGQSSELRKLPCEMLGGYRKVKFFVWITLSGRWWFFPGGFRWFWGSWEL